MNVKNLHLDEEFTRDDKLHQVGGWLALYKFLKM